MATAANLEPKAVPPTLVAQGKRRWPETAYLIVLLIGTFAVFAPTLRFGFVFDDISQIVENPHLTSWKYLPTYFTEHVWAQNRTTTPVYYRPLFLVMMRLDYILFGLQPWGWHLSLVLLHLLACVAVFYFLRYIAGQKIALIATAIFALHPIHAEAVSWLACLAEPLMTAALLTSFLFYLKAEKNWLWWSAGLYAVALLLKETAIVWPLFLFLAAYDGFERTLRKTLPFWLMAAFYFVIRSLVVPMPRVGVMPEMLMPGALVQYVWHLLLPVELSPGYDTPTGYAYLVAAIAIICGFIYIARINKLCRMAVLLLAIPMLPVINVGFMSHDYVHDRYLYLPSVGFALLVAMVLAKAPKTVLIVLFALFCAGSISEARPWRDEIHLFTRAVQMDPASFNLRNHLALAYIDADRCTEAMPLLKQAVVQEPYAFQVYVNLADCYERMGQIDDALRSWGTAEMLWPDREIELNIERLRKLRAQQSHSTAP